MKEDYFSSNSLELTVQSLEQALDLTARPGKFHFSPDQAALLALDLQAYFLNPASHAYIPSAPPILPRLLKLIAGFRAHHRPVIFTQHVNTPEDAGMMAVWWRDLIRPSSPMAALSPELGATEMTILRKSQYDAFYQTNLEARLQGLGVSQVVIVGVMTHLCCETTARAAFTRGFQVFFPIDGSATYTRDFHLATLHNLGHGFASLVTVQSLMAVLEGGDGR
jgi:nicotinamidase-related amidase